MINEISFKKTSNIFLNSGILGLYIYLEKYNDNKKKKYIFNYELRENELIVSSENLMELLEECYYAMGKDYYDISTKKQIEEADKFYFTKEPFSSTPFAKMKTMGLAGLINNDAQATAGKNGEKIKFDKLLKEDIEFAKKIAINLKEKGKKLKFYSISEENIISENVIENGKRKENKGGESEIFLNEGYTKTPKMEFDYSFFEKGEKKCSLTGEGFKKLLSSQNLSPLLGAIYNFESFNNFNSRNISWKSSYLSKFSPVVCFYNGLDKITCYFLSSSNLKKSLELYCEYKELFLDKNELVENNYMSNFRTTVFSEAKKEKTSKGSDLVLEFENLFGLLYSIYRKHFFNVFNREELLKDNLFNEFNLFGIIEKNPVIMTYFRADKFASTMRPVLFDEFNHYKYIMLFFYELEINKYDSTKIAEFLFSLKYLKNSDKNSKDKYLLERTIRNKILKNILYAKSFVFDIENLYYYSFSDLLVGEDYRYRNYNLIYEILNLYEKFIEFGGNKFMNEGLQEKSISFGKSIGIGILNYEVSESESKKNQKDKKLKNLKTGRKYLISLKKSRNLQQFLSEIERIQLRYNLVFSNELLLRLNSKNWEYIKSYSVISILNMFNRELLPEKNDGGKE